ncbi:MAG: flagellar hook-length control protein FliK, partial [Azoarcus sp.]|nr:flagellar hook-length control protein FliK [Azoarcus sp.]
LLGGGSSDKGADAGRLAALLGGKDAPDTEARDKNAAQILNLFAQANGSRSASGGAESMLAANARGEANMGGVQTAVMPFAARMDGAQAAQNTVVQLPVATTVGHRGWAAEVGNQVAWMLGRNESRAELQLTPPSLGKLGVSIQVNGDQTTAHFVAATQATRDALEQAMPRLREVLQQAGINLGQTSVGTSGDQSAPHERDGGSRRASGSGDDGAAIGIGTAPVANWIRGSNGVIDTFA